MGALLASFELGRKRGSKGKDKDDKPEAEKTPSFDERRRRNLQPFQPVRSTILDAASTDAGAGAGGNDTLLG